MMISTMNKSNTVIERRLAFPRTPTSYSNNLRNQASAPHIALSEATHRGFMAATLTSQATPRNLTHRNKTRKRAREGQSGDRRSRKNRNQASKLLQKVLVSQKEEASDPKSAMRSILTNPQAFSFPAKGDQSKKPNTTTSGIMNSDEKPGTV